MVLAVSSLFFFGFTVRSLISISAYQKSSQSKKNKRGQRAHLVVSPTPKSVKVVDAVVTSVNKYGIFAKVGPLSIFVSQHWIPDDLEFDGNSNPPCESRFPPTAPSNPHPSASPTRAVCFFLFGGVCTSQLCRVSLGCSYSSFFGS